MPKFEVNLDKATETELLQIKNEVLARLVADVRDRTNARALYNSHGSTHINNIDEKQAGQQ